MILALAPPDSDVDAAIGSASDFVRLDFAIDSNHCRALLSAVVVSNTHGWTMTLRLQLVDFSNDADAPHNEAINMIYDALDWCAANGITHDTAGWNQDPEYFARQVHAAVIRWPTPVERIVHSKEQEGT